jgi:hypothetical protein
VGACAEAIEGQKEAIPMSRIARGTFPIIRCVAKDTLGSEFVSIACWQAAVMQMVLSAKIGLDAVSHGYTMGNYLGFPRIRRGGNIFRQR